MIYGFEFQLARDGAPLGWFRVQGAGGLFGDGSLYQFDDGKPVGHIRLLRLQTRLKAKCDAMVRAEGAALVLVDPDAAPADRYRWIDGPLRVTGVRVLGGAG